MTPLINCRRETPCGVSSTLRLSGIKVTSNQDLPMEGRKNYTPMARRQLARLFHLTHYCFLHLNGPVYSSGIDHQVKCAGTRRRALGLPFNSPLGALDVEGVGLRVSSSRPGSNGPPSNLRMGFGTRRGLTSSQGQQRKPRREANQDGPPHAVSVTEGQPHLRPARS